MTDTATENLTEATTTQPDDVVLAKRPSIARLAQGRTGSAYFGKLEWISAIIDIADSGGNNAYTVRNDATHEPSARVTSVTINGQFVQLNISGIGVVGSVICKPSKELTGSHVFGPSVTSSAILILPKTRTGTDVSPTTGTALQAGSIHVLAAMWPAPR